jgi:hypothetical protein
MAREWLGEQGYLTFAANTRDSNYLELAYRLAESIKDTQSIKNVSIVIDHITASSIKDKHSRMFDRILVQGKDDRANSFVLEARAWDLTPYKQTIKIEADMLMTANLDHWWSILDERDVCLTTTVFKPTGQLVTDRSQRRLFDDNLLPDVYNAVYYFRYTRDSQQFFHLVKRIFQEWPLFRDQILKNCRKKEPATDEVFAIAALLYGIERCTLPFAVPAFLHMKNPLVDIPSDAPWWEYISYEQADEGTRVGFYQQRLPLHYQRKDFWNADR